VKCIAVISCVFFGQLSVSFLGPCCPAPLYCIAVHDCLILIEQINDDDDDDRENSPQNIRGYTNIFTVQSPVFVYDRLFSSSRRVQVCRHVTGHYRCSSAAVSRVRR